MKSSVEYFPTQVQAEQEGARCQAYMGPGYGYTYKVYFSEPLDKWVLDASWYSSCD